MLVVYNSFLTCNVFHNVVVIHEVRNCVIVLLDTHCFNANLNTKQWTDASEEKEILIL